jgi:hypothetical protein
VKSIACETELTVLELRSPTNEVNLDKFWPQLEKFYRREKTAATLLGMSEKAIYLAIDGNTKAIKPGFPIDGCVEAHIRRRQAILTLVGAGITDSSAFRQLPELLAPTGALILPGIAGSCVVHIAVPAQALLFTLEILNRAFFADCNPEHFALLEPSTELERVGSDSVGSSISRRESPLAAPRGPEDMTRGKKPAPHSSLPVNSRWTPTFGASSTE